MFIEGGYDVALTNEFKNITLFDTNPKVNQIYALIGLRLKLASDKEEPALRQPISWTRHQ